MGELQICNTLTTEQVCFYHASCCVGTDCKLTPETGPGPGRPQLLPNLSLIIPSEPGVPWEEKDADDNGELIGSSDEGWARGGQWNDKEDKTNAQSLFVKREREREIERERKQDKKR